VQSFALGELLACRRLTQMNADLSSERAELLRPAYPQAALTRRVIGVFYEVYNELGAGFLESVYQRAFSIALTDAGLVADREVPVLVRFRGRPVGRFHPDFLIERTVLVELKAARKLQPDHQAQLLNYLRASRFEVGLLLNFGPRPTMKRLAYANRRKTHLR
jgi:GxxExxY protein